MKRVWLLSFLIIGLLSATLPGCGKVSIGSGSDESPANVVGDEVSKNGWRGRSIVADCVVTFYTADGSTYLSEQRHTIRPESQVLEISANEPRGRFKWKLSRGDFQVIAGAVKLNDLPIAVCDRNAAKLILTSVTVASGMSTELGVSSELAKIRGRWYSIIRVGPGRSYSKTLKNIEVPWAELTLYGDSDSGMIERVTIEDTESGLTLTAHSYNFWWLKEISRSIPTKIDVFKTDKAGRERERILQVNYHTVKAL